MVQKALQEALLQCTAKKEVIISTSIYWHGYEIVEQEYNI